MAVEPCTARIYRFREVWWLPSGFSIASFLVFLFESPNLDVGGVFALALSIAGRVNVALFSGTGNGMVALFSLGEGAGSVALLDGPCLNHH